MGYLNCMKAGTLLLFVLFLSLHSSAQESCVPVRMPVIPDSIRKVFEEKLDKARSDFEKDTNNAEATTWYGRRLAYLGRYEEAIRIFSHGLVHHPTDARLLRHRGHRWITLRSSFYEAGGSSDSPRFPGVSSPDSEPLIIHQPFYGHFASSV